MQRGKAMSVHKVNVRNPEHYGQFHYLIGIGFGPATLICTIEVSHVGK
jgi:hypothetical protein